MQPRITQVPPKRSCSAMAVFAPISAASRAPRTPPEPAPTTNKSKSYRDANSASVLHLPLVGRSASVASRVGGFQLGLLFLALDDADAAGAGKNERGCEADEEAVLDHARHHRQPGGERGRIADHAERTIVDHVAAVGAKDGDVLHAQIRAHVVVAERLRH